MLKHSSNSIRPCEISSRLSGSHESSKLFISSLFKFKFFALGQALSKQFLSKNKDEKSSWEKGIAEKKLYAFSTSAPKNY